MYINSKLTNSVRLALAMGALSAVSSTNVLAQTTDAGAEDVERIAVTGSRIQRTDIETPVPITTIGRQDILDMGALNAADVLNTSPVAIAGSDQSNTSFANSGVGLNTTSLRNLGESRTLVLVNGRRYVSGVSPSAGYAVDLNSIPASMIERIEILKSASSAIYGSDAVAGVVNIITRSEFEGVELNAQTGISSESDREKYSLNFTAGNSWDTGRASISVGYDEDKGLKSSDRDFSRYDEAIGLDDDGNEVVIPLYSSYPPQGRIGGYNGDGTPFNFESGGDGNRFNRASYRQLVTPLERKYVAMNLHQEMSDTVEYFVEANWNSSETNDSTIEPTPFDIVNDVWFKDRGGIGGIDLNDPATALVMPELLRTNLIADGYTNINEVGFVRRMVEFGARSTDVERSTIRVAHGVDWEINDNWIMNAYMSWGKTDQTQDNGGQVNVERAALALDWIVDPTDPTQAICADADARLQGCVPLDMFGAGTVTDQAVAYVRSPAKTIGKVEQFIMAASVTGELPFELDGGYVAMAAGVEHRLEKGAYSPGDLAQTGSSSTNKSDPTNGSFTSDDIFVEFILPVFEGFELDLAARYADHEIVGGQTTWNAGLAWEVVEGFKFRASAATAVRTPNVADLYGGRGETFATVSDPCSGTTNATEGNIAANCRSIAEVQDRINNDPDGTFTLTQVEAQSTGGTIGGNPNVSEETADTYSVGFIWQVMDGLSMTLDYYDVSVDDAISTTSRTTVLNRCYDVAPGEFDASCGVVDGIANAVRDQNGALTAVNSGTSNENEIETSGVDIELNYTMELGPGTFTTDLIWNHTREYVVTSIESGTSVDYSGEVLTPENRANLNFGYQMDDLYFSWRVRYWDSSVDSVEEANWNFDASAPLTTYNNFGTVIYHDLSSTYHLDGNTSFTVGMRNAFDKQPPVANQSSVNGGTGINTVSEAYDVTGRYFQAAVTMKF